MEFKILKQTKNIHLVIKSRYSASSNLFKHVNIVKKLPLRLHLVYLSNEHKKCNHTAMMDFLCSKSNRNSTINFNKLIQLHPKRFNNINKEIPVESFVAPQQASLLVKRDD